MEVAIVAVAALLALSAQQYLHTRAVERLNARWADITGDLASRVVRPTAPVPRKVVKRDDDAELPEPPRSHAHLVGHIAPDAE